VLPENHGMGVVGRGPGRPMFFGGRTGGEGDAAVDFFSHNGGGDRSWNGRRIFLLGSVGEFGGGEHSVFRMEILWGAGPGVRGGPSGGRFAGGERVGLVGSALFSSSMAHRCHSTFLTKRPKSMAQPPFRDPRWGGGDKPLAQRSGGFRITCLGLRFNWVSREGGGGPPLGPHFPAAAARVGSGAGGKLFREDLPEVGVEGPGGGGKQKENGGGLIWTGARGRRSPGPGLGRAGKKGHGGGRAYRCFPKVGSL